MRSRVLSVFALVFSLPAVGLILEFQGHRLTAPFAAFAEPTGLMRGCTDIPEAVALADSLQTRALRIERYMESLDAKKAEIAAAEESLRARVAELKAQKTGLQSRRNGTSAAVRDDIDRLVALYDQMKPAEAAAILTNLPSDFAAEILMRVNPETGARIIAAVEPRQAALLTAEMGARSVRNR